MSHRRKVRKIGDGPNDLCPCGSGKKHKKCHPTSRSKGPSVFKVRPRRQMFQDMPIPIMAPGAAATTGMMDLATLAAMRKHGAIEESTEGTESTEVVKKEGR